MLGIEANTLLTLKKAMQGQVDAPRRWYQRATSQLRGCGFIANVLDPCGFLNYDEEGKFDGFVAAGHGQCYRSRIEKLKTVHIQAVED